MLKLTVFKLINKQFLELDLKNNWDSEEKNSNKKNKTAHELINTKYWWMILL